MSATVTYRMAYTEDSEGSFELLYTPGVGFSVDNPESADLYAEDLERNPPDNMSEFSAGLLEEVERRVRKFNASWCEKKTTPRLTFELSSSVLTLWESHFPFVFTFYEQVLWDELQLRGRGTKGV